jgi:hypothetical protein
MNLINSINDLGAGLSILARGSLAVSYSEYDTV